MPINSKFHNFTARMVLFYVQLYAIHPVKMEASALQRGHATVHQNGQENAAKLVSKTMYNSKVVIHSNIITLNYCSYLQFTMPERRALRCSKHLLMHKWLDRATL